MVDELVERRRGPWRTLDDVEIATLEWVDWFNNRRVQTELGDIPPAEHEALLQGSSGTRLQESNSTEGGTHQSLH